MLTPEQRIGAFFLVGIVLFLVAVELTLGLGLLHDRYPLYVTFADVQGLDKGADVRLAGLRAGRVDSMRIDGRHVVVKLNMDHDVEIRRDAVARLDFRALSGERFVTISLGTPTAPVVKAGDTIEGETPAGFTEIVDQLADVAESVTGLADSLRASSERLLSDLGDLVAENRGALGAMAQNVASITDKLDRGTGTLGLLLNDPTLYTRATDALTDVQQSVRDLGQVAHGLAAGEGTLGKLLTRDDGLYSQMRDTLDDLSQTARNAQEITDGLRTGQGTIGKALTDDALYTEAHDTLRSVNRATQSVEDQSAISLLGTIVTSLF